MEFRSKGVDAPAPVEADWVRKFEEDLSMDESFERKLLHREVWIVGAIVLFLVLRQVAS